MAFVAEAVSGNHIATRRAAGPRQQPRGLSEAAVAELVDAGEPGASAATHSSALTNVAASAVTSAPGSRGQVQARRHAARNLSVSISPEGRAEEPGASLPASFCSCTASAARNLVVAAIHGALANTSVKSETRTSAAGTRSQSRRRRSLGLPDATRPRSSDAECWASGDSASTDVDETRPPSCSISRATVIHAFSSACVDPRSFDVAREGFFAPVLVAARPFVDPTGRPRRFAAAQRAAV
mmetsp:Transcript_5663/g.17826  ORF Transcript_5663/g.17826 Transcript_5663/m.17826 type:complete len:240 (-) Transcript_5663:26-745(-)